MSRIRHISFDVWNTLISPNPEFAKARDRFLSKAFEVSEFEVRSTYKTHKQELDKRAETKGIGLSSENIYKEFMVEYISNDLTHWKYIRAGLEELFRAYPPIVLPLTLFVIGEIRRRGMTVSIASNTNFIRGDVLEAVALFDISPGSWIWAAFSDQLQWAKPNPGFWAYVVNTGACTLRLKPEEMLHVGDNLICDGSCVNHGLEFQYVTGPSDLAKVLERI